MHIHHPKLFHLFFLLFLFSCQENSREKEPIALPEHTTDSLEKIPDSLLIPSLFIPQDSVYAFMGGNYMLYGFKNRQGKTILSPRFTLAHNFVNGLAPIVRGEHHGFCDTSGKTVVRLPNGLRFDIRANEMSGEWFFQSLGESLIGVVNSKGLHGYVNDSGRLVIPCIFEEAQVFSEGMAVIIQNEKYGFIDKKGEIKIPCRYEYAMRFSCGRACVGVRSKRGFIDHKGAMVIPAIYSEAWLFSEGLCNVSIEANPAVQFYIDTTGQTMIKGPFDETGYFEKGKAQVSRGQKCWEIDKTGKKIRSLHYPCFVGC